MSTISSSTTSTTAYKVTADTTGTLVIQTGATPTTAVTVDASQNVGIGTTSPAYKLDILTGGGGVYAAQFGNGTAAQGMRIVTGMDSTSSGITTGGGTRLIQFDGTSNVTQFYTNGSERMRIDSSGNVGIGVTPTSILDVRTANDALANVQSTGTIQSAILNLIGRQASVDNTWSIVSTGSGLSGAQLRFTRGGWTGTPSMLIDSSSNLQFNSGYGSAATAYGCRAWVNFDGVTTATIRASGNVTSVTRNSAGDYTINFTNAMPDVNYCVTSSNKYDNANTSFANGVTVVARYTTAYQTGSVRVQTGISAATDTVAVCVAIFR